MKKTITFEIWKEIPGTKNGVYFCSNKGNFKKKLSDGSFKEMAKNKAVNNNGRVYTDVHLVLDTGVRATVRSSRAIAKTFLDNNFPLLASKGCDTVINHIDNNPANENLSNLEIVSRADNLRLAYKNKPFGKPQLRCYAKKEGYYKEFNSTAELVREITNTNNKGYFNHALVYQHKLKGYEVGYVK